MLGSSKEPGGLRVGEAPASGSDDTTTRSTLSRIVALSADLFDAPWAVLWLTDSGRISIGAQTGLGANVGFAAGDLPERFAALSGQAGPLVVVDAASDPRFDDHPLVTGPPNLRFLVAAPLRSHDGTVAGLLCVLDAAARPQPSRRDVDRLDALAALAADAFDGGRRDRAALADARAKAAAKSDLLADVSHEMRTPLNGIVGFTELLRRDGALDHAALRTVERIAEAGHGLLTIVEDALHLSTLETGQVRLHPRSFSPRQLVEDAVAIVRPSAERKGLHLLVDVADAPTVPLIGDPDRLRQVLLNLLSNAVKFTGTGTIRVTLAYDPGDDAQGPLPLRLTVEDSGVGFDRASIPRLFDRFVQADGTVSRRFGGTGLGLAISKTLMETMGGAIAVESSPGIGSRFIVSLVLPRAQTPEPAPPPAHVARDGTRDALRGCAVLLAEDVKLNQKLVLQMLEPLGATIDVVADGAAALAAVTRRDYALVLMDMEMPVIDGIEATRRIRAMGGAFARLPIVALTANVFPEQLDLCREAGMDAHLTKPFGADDLVATALRWARRLAPACGGG